jgi:hypothetical protein
VSNIKFSSCPPNSIVTNLLTKVDGGQSAAMPVRQIQKIFEINYEVTINHIEYKTQFAKNQDKNILTHLTHLTKICHRITQNFQKNTES